MFVMADIFFATFSLLVVLLGLNVLLCCFY
jgi:hypothetical protein